MFLKYDNVDVINLINLIQMPFSPDNMWLKVTDLCEFNIPCIIFISNNLRSFETTSIRSILYTRTFYSNSLYVSFGRGKPFATFRDCVSLVRNSTPDFDVEAYIAAKGVSTTLGNTVVYVEVIATTTKFLQWSVGIRARVNLFTSLISFNRFG